MFKLLQEQHFKNAFTRSNCSFNASISWFLLGAKALGGMLAGGLLGCVLLALMMANAGGAWDNAKKYIEKEISVEKVQIHMLLQFGRYSWRPF